MEGTEKVAGAVTRRSLLKGIGALGVGAVAGRAGVRRAAGYDSPETQRIADTAMTAEALLVTLMGVARQRGDAGRLAIDADLDVYLRAAQCEEEAHYQFFAAVGGKPTTSTFTIPNRVVASRGALLRALRELEEMLVGAYMAAARQFAELGKPRLVEIAYQIGAVEAQHLALVRSFLGEVPANDRAFAQWRFGKVTEAGQALAATGFLDGPGEPYEYPGPVDRFCRGVYGLVPTTTPDEIATPVPAPVSE